MRGIGILSPSLLLTYPISSLIEDKEQIERIPNKNKKKKNSHRLTSKCESVSVQSIYGAPKYTHGLAGVKNGTKLKGSQEIVWDKNQGQPRDCTRGKSGNNRVYLTLPLPNIRG